MINTEKDRKNLYRRVGKLDIISRIRPLLEKQGYIVRTEDDKIVPKMVSAGWDSPWIYVQSDPTARCDIFHKVFYNILGHIPTYCRNCWKVVVRPQTLTQLLDLYELQKDMGVPCKCGIERRDSVFGLYGGYFYNQGKERGIERYHEVRALVDEHLGKDVPVILKRYCTEFEIGGTGVSGQGDSLTTEDTTPEEKEMEEYILHHFPRVGHNNPQAKHLVATVIQRWIMYAYKNGDETYKEVTNGEPLFPPYRMYHNKEKEKWR